MVAKHYTGSLWQMLFPRNLYSDIAGYSQPVHRQMVARSGNPLQGGEWQKE